MAKFIVELRNNRPGYDESQPPEAYLGTKEVEDGHPEGPKTVSVPRTDRNRATEYETEGRAKYDLDRLPDAFFDRYAVKIVDVAGAVPGPWDVHVTTDQIISGDSWIGQKEKVVGTVDRYSVIARGETNEKTVLIAEINDSVRNPWRFPLDPEATARLIAAAPDLLAACSAALAYDAAIQRRVVDGAVNIMATGGAVAQGDDLDSLYEAWIVAARAAVAKARGQ